MKPVSLTLTAALAAVGMATAASAAPVLISFDGLDGTAGETPGAFYAGGLGGLGSGPGSNFGITFSDDARVACSIAFACDDPEISGPTNVLRFLDPRAAFGADPDAPSVMNVAGGFNGQLSFDYANAAASSMVRIWSGAGGTGSLLASISLSSTCADGPCDFRHVSGDFAGVAHSVEFVNFDFRLSGIDDIALMLFDGGAGAVPEPATWALMLAGFGTAGAMLRRRRAATA